MPKSLTQAQCTAYARDGYDVAFSYAGRADAAKQVVADIQKAGRKAVAIQSDIADPAQVVSLFDRAAQEIGYIEAFVSNAGIIHKGAPLADIPIEDIKRIIEVARLLEDWAQAQAAADDLETKVVLLVDHDGAALVADRDGDGAGLFLAARAGGLLPAGVLLGNEVTLDEDGAVQGRSGVEVDPRHARREGRPGDLGPDQVEDLLPLLL